MSNPAFTRSSVFNGKNTNLANTTSEVMTIENALNATLIAFSVLVGGAAIGWFIPALGIVGVIGGLVLALVNIFKKVPSRGLILTYAGVEGLAVGAVSNFYNEQFQGIVPQAVFGTLAFVGVVLFLFRSGRIRASAKFTKIFLLAFVGYLVFQVVNLLLEVTNVTHSYFGLLDVHILGIPLGILLAPLIAILGAYSLVLDFDYIQRAVAGGFPKIYAWQGAFGIVLTVVWLYFQILQLLGVARR